MEIFIIILLLILIAVTGFLGYLFFVKSNKKSEAPETMLLMQQQIQELSRTVREQMNESSRLVQ